MYRKFYTENASEQAENLDRKGLKQALSISH